MFRCSCRAEEAYNRLSRAKAGGFQQQLIGPVASGGEQTRCQEIGPILDEVSWLLSENGRRVLPRTRPHLADDCKLHYRQTVRHNEQNSTYCADGLARSGGRSRYTVLAMPISW